jgi:hypothetical protein
MRFWSALWWTLTAPIGAAAVVYDIGKMPGHDERKITPPRSDAAPADIQR